MIACPPRHPFLFRFFFLSWPFLSTFYLPSSRIDYTYSFFFFAGLSSKYWWGVWYRVFGRHQPSLDGIIWSLKYFWELPPSTPHLSQSHRSAQWGRSSHVSSQVWISKKSWMMISDCSVLNSGSFRPCKICHLQKFMILVSPISADIFSKIALFSKDFFRFNFLLVPIKFVYASGRLRYHYLYFWKWNAAQWEKGEIWNEE